MTGRVVSVNLGLVTRAAWAGDPSGRTGIDKRPTTEPVALRTGGVAGDFVGELSVHGGPDKAVYSYAREDADWWSRELGREIPPGGFGENLSTEGVDLTGAVIGEQWQVGSALLQVSQPRTPCRTFAGFWDVRDLIKRFVARALPGAYLRVLREGEVTVGDSVTVVHRPAHGITIGETFRALNISPELLPRLLDVPELPAHLRERAERRTAGRPG
ncbi:MOSC domain-containing protein [Micromonospora sp. NBC_01699]|uniref:MOSC domain-containing protein n=1 Tax=Micromonospora sp. NBC_01699 TaxID=2975984 RepID=UPI002E283B5F|nr:MOSC domain-containing protein [Micromonospora sp. NBC_01699]